MNAAVADPGTALVRGTHLRWHQLPGQERNEVVGPDENKWERSVGDFAWRELCLLGSRTLPSDPRVPESRLLFVTATCPAWPQQASNTLSS